MISPVDSNAVSRVAGGSAAFSASSIKQLPAGEQAAAAAGGTTIHTFHELHDVIAGADGRMAEVELRDVKAKTTRRVRAECSARSSCTSARRKAVRTRTPGGEGGLGHVC